MLKKLSVKTKLIILFILSIIAIGIIVIPKVLEIYEQGKIQEGKIEYLQAEIQKTKEENEIEEKQRKLKEEKDKILLEKYTEGYKAFKEGKYQTAIKLEDEVIKEESEYYKAYTIKGIALCYSKQFKEGLKNIDKALEIKPNYSYGVFNKALAYEYYGHYDDALNWYDKALELEDYVWSYYRIAAIYAKKNDAENSVLYLKTAIEMDETIKEQVKKDLDFANVKNDKEFVELIK